MYITRVASNENFSPSNKIHREVGRTKDLSAPLYINSCSIMANIAKQLVFFLSAKRQKTENDILYCRSTAILVNI